MFLLRTFLLWAVMLAVPFQGQAAASMAFCASAPQSGPHHSTVSLPRPEPMSGSALAPTAPHGEGHGHHAQAAATPGAGDDHLQAASADGGSTHTCGTCGACHAVALIAEVPAAVPHGPPPADGAEPIVAIAQVAVRVPDKPPRA